MSIESLRQLEAEHAFDPSPRREDLWAYFVPFEELVEGARVDTEFARAVRVPERVALVGPSGAGKTSLIESVLSPMEEKVAPIRVPVAAEDDSTVTDPAAFVQHLVRTVSRQAERARALSSQDVNAFLRQTSDRIKRPGAERHRRASFGFASWIFKGDLGSEIVSVGESIDQKRSGAEIVDQARLLLETIQAHSLMPILIIDDSDSWLNIPGVHDRSGLVGPFFGRVLRLLAELPAGLVVAVHEHYLADAGYKQATGFLESVVTLPTLSSPEALGKILARRMAAHDLSEEVIGVISDEALADLAAFYAGPGSRSLRKSLQIAHTALHLACADEADVISQRFIEAAAAEWS